MGEDREKTVLTWAGTPSKRTTLRDQPGRHTNYTRLLSYGTWWLSFSLCWDGATSRALLASQPVPALISPFHQQHQDTLCRLSQSWAILLCPPSDLIGSVHCFWSVHYFWSVWSSWTQELETPSDKWKFCSRCTTGLLKRPPPLMLFKLWENTCKIKFTPVRGTVQCQGAYLCVVAGLPSASHASLKLWAP